MKKAKIIAAVAIVLSAAVLMGCSPRNAMSTLSTESDSETAEVFSLTKVLDLGTNYLVSLDYENAILQYIDIIQHDPKNKEAYAGLYAAYAAQGKTDEASEVLNKAQEVFENDAEFLPEFLKDANLVYENGGGNNPFQFLSNQYWDDTNAIFAKDVSDAWLEAEPDNAEPYALLGAYYSAQDDENGKRTGDDVAGENTRKDEIGEDIERLAGECIQQVTGKGTYRQCGKRIAGKSDAHRRASGMEDLRQVERENRHQKIESEIKQKIRCDDETVTRCDETFLCHDDAFSVLLRFLPCAPPSIEAENAAQN